MNEMPLCDNDICATLLPGAHKRLKTSCDKRIAVRQLAENA
jgi:hypothetical protein